MIVVLTLWSSCWPCNPRVVFVILMLTLWSSHCPCDPRVFLWSPCYPLILVLSLWYPYYLCDPHRGRLCDPRVVFVILVLTLWSSRCPCDPRVVFLILVLFFDPRVVFVILVLSFDPRVVFWFSCCPLIIVLSLWSSCCPLILVLSCCPCGPRFFLVILVLSCCPCDPVLTLYALRLPCDPGRLHSYEWGISPCGNTEQEIGSVGCDSGRVLGCSLTAALVARACHSAFLCLCWSAVRCGRYPLCVPACPEVALLLVSGLVLWRDYPHPPSHYLLPPPPPPDRPVYTVYMVQELTYTSYSLHTQRTHSFIHASKRVRIHTHKHARTHTHIRTRKKAHTHTRIHTCTHAHARTHTHVRTRTHIRTNAHTRTRARATGKFEITASKFKLSSQWIRTPSSNRLGYVNSLRSIRYDADDAQDDGDWPKRHVFSWCR